MSVFELKNKDLPVLFVLLLSLLPPCISMLLLVEALSSKSSGSGSGNAILGPISPAPILYVNPVRSSVLKMQTLPGPWPMHKYSGYTSRPLEPVLFSLTTTVQDGILLEELEEVDGSRVSNFATQKWTIVRLCSCSQYTKIEPSDSKICVVLDAMCWQHGKCGSVHSQLWSHFSVSIW